MKKCSNCGAQLPDDELFCPSCGEEVQLVPIFETVESSIKEQQKILEEKERERQALFEMEEEERERALRKRNTILFSVGAVVLIVVAFFSISFILKTSKKSAFNSKYTKAVEAYNSGDYDSSLDLITVALEKDPGNMEGQILMADIYAAQGNTDMAASLYLQVIESNPGSESAYRKLIGMYEVLGQGNNIHTLLSRCTSESILEKFSEYVTSVPAFSLESGTYESVQSMTLSADDGNSIYYTLDGTDPSNISLLYTGTPIDISGGTVTVRAIAYNSKGVPSDVVEAKYVIDAEYTEPPVIFPRGNTFTFSDGKTHAFTVIVPRGTKALYSYDEMPTNLSAAYTGPVDMLEGTHTFYAVLIDKKSGVMSTPTSISYTLSASEIQESISVVQDADGNYSASYSDGTSYVPYTPDYSYVDPTPSYDGGGQSGGGSSGGGQVTPDPGPSGGGESDGGSSGGGESGGGSSGGGEVTPDPGPGGGGESGGGESGGGEVTPDPGPGGGESGGGESGGGESGGGESGGGESGGGESGGGESGGSESGGSESAAADEAPAALTE